MTYKRTQRNKIKIFGVFFSLVIAAVCHSLISTPKVYSANANDIIINELNYNPVSDNDDDEFLEIHNTTSNSIDLEGWCFTEGITLCFPANSVIAANGYAVISRNAVQTQITYGVTTIATYTGMLDNGGETVILADNNSDEIDTVEYDDTSPWPMSPDGNGPSLELKHPTYDNSQVSSWGASLENNGTPGIQNSLFDADLPEISEVTKPTAVQSSETVTITAKALNTTSATLTYKVMFDSEQTVTMYDDGSHGDTTPSDNVYSAQIPSQSAGKLVRFKVTATNINGQASAPGNDDTVNYSAYIVEDGQTASLPIVRWYIEPAVYTDLITNHLTDDFYVPTVVAIGDKIFDNAKVRVKGQSSVTYAKRKFKFELPSGYQLGAPYFQNPVDEFALNVYFLNMTDLQEKLAWQTFTHFGFNDVANFYVQVHKNEVGQPTPFYGHYLLTDGYDKNWRERNDYDSGALYKASNDKKTRLDEDNSDIQDLMNKITTLQGEALKQYILDNLNVPSFINYHALTTATLSQDWSFYGNIYQYRDTEGTERWQYLPYDLDNAYAMPIFNAPPGERNAIPLDPLFTGDSPHTSGRIIENAMYQFPEFREMYYRRFSTIYDQLYKSGLMSQWYQQLYAKSSNTIGLDLAKWSADKTALLNAYFPDGLPYEFPDDFPFPITPDEALTGNLNVTQQDEIFKYGIERLIRSADQQRVNGEFPATQPSQPRVSINELNYNPQSSVQDNEYIELYNPNDYAVDISNWSFTSGVGLTLPEGSVIPAKGFAMVVNQDTAFRSSYPGSQVVLAEYSGSLSNQGETVTLSRTDGSVSSSVTYGINNDWPENSNGQGYSLALIRAAADTTLASCWAPSLSIGGTPGANNSLNQSWVNEHSADCKDHNYTVLAKTGTNTTKLTLAGFSVMILSTLYIAFDSMVKRKRKDSLIGLVKNV